MVKFTDASEATAILPVAITSPISVVVPVYNEEENVIPLIKRIYSALTSQNIDYEIVFVDDRSTDKTVANIRSMARRYPIRVFTKQGTKGKAYSLQEGFEHARYPLICMIDGDLQYPPEAIPGMAKALHSEAVDIIQTRRIDNNTSGLRKLSTKIFNFVFAQLLFGIKFDTQSGLKLFKKDILQSVDLQSGAWSFDLDFLVKSMQQGYKVASYDISFSERLHGEVKINVFTAAIEMALASIKLKFNNRNHRLAELLPSRNLTISALLIAATVVMFDGSASALSLSTAAKSGLQTAERTVGINSTPAQSTAKTVTNTPVSAPAVTNPVTVKTASPAAPATSPAATTPSTVTASSGATNATTGQQAAATSAVPSATTASSTAAATGGSNAAAGHLSPRSTINPYQASAAISPKQASSLSRVAIIFLETGIVVMLIGATLYGITKALKTRQGQLAVR